MPPPNKCLYIDLSLITNLAVLISRARLADGGTEGSNKISAVGFDEAISPSVETTGALLGHQLEHLWSFVGKKKNKTPKNIVECCRLVTAFGTLELPILAGY